MTSQKLNEIVSSLIGMTKKEWQNLKKYRGYTKEFQQNIKNEKIKNTLEVLKGVNKKDWKGLKSYINLKMELADTIKDRQLIYDTLETFFIKVED